MLAYSFIVTLLKKKKSQVDTDFQRARVSLSTFLGDVLRANSSQQ